MPVIGEMQKTLCESAFALYIKAVPKRWTFDT